MVNESGKWRAVGFIAAGEENALNVFLTHVASLYHICYNVVEAEL